jgi:tetratricopeptide (TPR) repeat protein
MLKPAEPQHKRVEPGRKHSPGTSLLSRTALGRPRAADRAIRSRWPGWLAIAGGSVLALVVCLGVWRGSAPAPPAKPSVALPPEDPIETRFRAAVEAAPADARARMELGSYYEAHDRPFEAMWEYAEVGRLAPASPDLPLRVAAVLRAGQVIDLATERLAALVGARPGDLTARRQLVEIDLATAQPERARQLMEAQRALVWQDADAVVALARAREAAGDAAGAAAALRRSIALEYGNHEAWHRLGRLFLRQGRSAAARDAFLHAMAANRSRPEYPFYVGMTYLQQHGPGDPERALSYFREALALQPRYAPAHYYSGVAMERMGRPGQATMHYSYAILADPNYPEAHLALGRALGSAGNLQESHRTLGRYYDIKDRPSDALREFRQMSEETRSTGQPALLASQVYIRTQQERQAAAVTEAALQRHPDDAQLLERLAVLKINRGDRPYARRLLHRWLKLQPESSRPYWLLGRCEFGDLKFGEGIGWLETALAREPRNPHYLGFLGAGLLRLGTPESRQRAVEVLQQAVALSPDDADYRDLYGQALQRIGQYDAARRQFLKALNADPSRITVYTPVSQLAWRLKRVGPAAFLPPVIRSVQQRVSEEKLLWPHVWDHPGDAAGRLKLARFFCRTAHLDRARDQLEQILAQRPDWPEARELMTTVQRAIDVQ